VISFVIGRLFYVLAVFIQTKIFLPKATLELFDAAKAGTPWERLTPKARQLILGAVSSPLLNAAGTPWELWAVGQAEVSFRFSTGLALVLASLIPGDGRMRLLEGLAGAYFISFGVIHARKMIDMGFTLLGSTAISVFMNSTEEQRKMAMPFQTSESRINRFATP
jgi:hypothetical protein